MIFDHERLHEELDWLAVDIDGRVGYFATGGAGPIPATVHADLELYDSIEDDVLALPVSCETEPYKSVQWDVSEWLEIARRGLSAYDWDRESRQYELVARPSAGLHIEDLPDGALKVTAARTKLPVRFAEITSLQP